MQQSEDMTFIAKTIFGLEEVLAGELNKLGAREVEQLNRAVKFVGDKGMLYKANLGLRTALRILVPVATFEVRDESDFYKEIMNIDWDQFMDVDDTLAVDTVLGTDLFSHSHFISQKTKDAIADQFRLKYDRRPSVDLDQPQLRIHIHIADTTCQVLLDSSGESLHKRGYRGPTNLAPINEVLAAGMVLLSGWDRVSPLVDPMCGSGTILIEAAMIAAGIPPGYYRSSFGFMRWKKYLPYDNELWETIYNAAISRISSKEVSIIGGELSHHVCRKAKENVKLARVEDMVTIKESDITEFIPPEGNGIAILNPPYGERMNQDDLTLLYKSIGDAFKKNFTGYSCWLITSNMEALKHVGLRPSRKIKIFNGPLECRYVKYEMYRGTKKIHKLNRENADPGKE